MNHSTNHTFDKLREYEKRSRKFEPDAQGPGASADEWSGVTFSLGDTRLACRVGRVTEILSCPQATPMPGADDRIIGPANVRGELLTRDGRNEQEWIRLGTDLRAHSQQLAKSAGEALKRIESVSKDLSSMIEGISQEAQAQSEVAKQIASQMNSIRDVSLQTSEGRDQTARSKGRLADLVRKLGDSVADFKLPKFERPERDA